jgi:hypothetical protein
MIDNGPRFFSFIKNCSGGYVIKIDLGFGYATIPDGFLWTVIVNETIQSKEQIKLMVNYVFYDGSKRSLCD